MPPVGRAPYLADPNRGLACLRSVPHAPNDGHAVSPSAVQAPFHPTPGKDPAAEPAAAYPPMTSPTLRNRLLATLILVALIPAGITLAVASLSLREIVQTTGSSGAWDEVAVTGREVLDRIDAEPPGTVSPELLIAAERHRDHLGSSVRLARIYALLGERFLLLLPLFSLALLLLIGGLAIWSANRLARGLARPAEELAGWTRLLGAGKPLPADSAHAERREVREFTLLRQSLRTMAAELEHTREREMDQARMRSWSEMARRVAHEIKNPLMPMRMAADRVVASSDERVAAAGRVLAEEIDRLEGLARSFAQFGRPPEGPMSEIDLGELIASVVRRTGDGPVPVTVDLPDEPVRIMGHLEALERVIRNLVVNAQDAAVMGNPDAPPTPVEVCLTPLTSGAEIRVLDRGTGIAPKLLTRIWEPEFTTKRKGTGIGLPLVRQAVRAHGGEVWAGNREGGGAEFRVRLPITPPAR